MSLKTERYDQKRKTAQLTQLSMQAPVPVRIKEWFPQENRVTVQIIAKGDPELDNTTIEGVKFPLLGPTHQNMGSMSIVAGRTEALLFYPGMQIRKGYVTLAHTSGTEASVTYSPVRHSWACG